MSSSDDPDTNTSDKCVSGERQRERERDSGVVFCPCHMEPYRSEPVVRKAFILTEPDEQDRLLYKLLLF